jgi:hypothetical protein
MKTDAVVRRGHPVAAVSAPVLDQAIDCARIKIRPVGEHDDGGLRIRR